MTCFDHVSQTHKTDSIFELKAHTTGDSARKVLSIMRFQFLHRKKQQYIQDFSISIAGNSSIFEDFSFSLGRNRSIFN